MKLCMFSPRGMQLERGWPGRVEGDRVVQLAAQTLQSFFTGGGAARAHAEYPLAEVELRAPVLHPPALRMFTGRDFVFGNPEAIYGPEDVIPWPRGARTLELGLGVAAVVGADGALGGCTLANTWRAPDLPGAKSRDFALSIGPLVDTERTSFILCAGSRQLELAPEWDALLAHAALNTSLRPGDLLVVDGGPGGVLAPGDAAELSADDLGVLRNRVADETAQGVAATSA